MASESRDLLFKKAGVGLCLVADDGLVITADAEWLTSMGLTHEQAVGQDILAVFPGSCGLAATILARARTGESVDLPPRVQYIGGRETWWEHSVLPVPMAAGVGLLISAREISTQVATPHEYTVRKKDGNPPSTPVHSTPIISAGAPVGLQAFVLDITERKRMQEEVAQAAQQWQATFDAIGDMVVILDRERRVLRANRAMIHACPDAVPGARCYQFFHGTDAPIAICPTCRTFETGEIAQVERFEPHLGRWLEFSAYPIADRDGRIQQVVHIARDITERKQIDAQLLRAQRLEVAGRMAAQVAHDLNNLLVSMTGYPELIKMQLPEDHPAIPFCDAMLDAADLMAGINEDMMALGQRGNLKLLPTDLNRVVQQALAQMPKPPESLTVELHLAADLVPVSGSDLQLTRVVLNLAANARDAMADSGRLRINTENVSQDESADQCDRVRTGKYVRLTVSDNGPGIAPEIRSKIFEPFFTTKEADGKRRGTGLGLSIVYSIVDDHQGYLDVESEVGKGTTFAVYLPVSSQALKEAPSQRITPRDGAYSGGG